MPRSSCWMEAWTQALTPEAHAPMMEAYSPIQTLVKRQPSSRQHQVTVGQLPLIQLLSVQTTGYKLCVPSLHFLTKVLIKVRKKLRTKWGKNRVKWLHEWQFILSLFEHNVSLRQKSFTTVFSHNMMFILKKKIRSTVIKEDNLKNLSYLNNNDLQGDLRSKHTLFNNSL